MPPSPQGKACGRMLSAPTRVILSSPVILGSPVILSAAKDPSLPSFRLRQETGITDASAPPQNDGLERRCRGAPSRRGPTDSVVWGAPGKPRPAQKRCTPKPSPLRGEGGWPKARRMRGRWTEQEAKFNAPAHPHPLQCAHWSTFPLEGGRFYRRAESSRPIKSSGATGASGKPRPTEGTARNRALPPQ